MIQSHELEGFLPDRLLSQHRTYRLSGSRSPRNSHAADCRVTAAKDDDVFLVTDPVSFACAYRVFGDAQPCKLQ